MSGSACFPCGCSVTSDHAAVGYITVSVHVCLNHVDSLKIQPKLEELGRVVCEEALAWAEEHKDENR